MFDIPIVLLIFKRSDAMKKIIKIIAKVRPNKIYIIADGGRDKKEHQLCIKCRESVEKLINWDCEIIKNYANQNRGVYKNIGEGAKWVFEKEKWAIFLEDDNLPEVTFFKFCAEMLRKYEYNEKVLWVCGTNYLGEYKNQYSYVFTKHMLPCGWASWGNKFLKYYDGYLVNYNNQILQKEFKKSFMLKGCKSHTLYLDQVRRVERTSYLIKNNIQLCSWDYQMNFAVRSHDMYGISPSVNQIRNIGVDEFSVHGGAKMSGVVKKLCGMSSYELKFPLVHPPKIDIDKTYESAINKILMPPFYLYPLRKLIIEPLKKALGMNKYDSFKEYITKKK